MKKLSIGIILAGFGLALAAGCGDGDSDGDGADDADGANPHAIGQQVPWPTTEWTTATPEEMGMDAALLEEALDYAFENINPPSLRTPGDPTQFPFDNLTQGVVVIRGGAIVAERYAPDPRNGAPKNKDSWAASWSMAKSFSSTLVGLMIDQGLIESVDVPMTRFFPEWVGRPGFEDITLRNVLQMQSGIDFSESYTDTECFSMLGDMQCAEVLEIGLNPDQLGFMLSTDRKLDPARERGGTWYYSSGDTQLLTGAVHRVIEEQGLPFRNAFEFGKAHLFDRIGMSNFPLQWWEDGTGATVGYGFLDTTTRNFARFGLLFLRGGQWDGEQVVSKEWTTKATTDAAAGSREYAYQWWLPGQRAATTLPTDLYAAEGRDNQKIWVIPSLDLVVVRNSHYKKPLGPDGVLGTADDAIAENGFVTELLPAGVSFPGFNVDPDDPNVPYGSDSGIWFLDCAFLGPIINSIEGAPKVEFCNDAGGSDPNEASPIFNCREQNSTCLERLTSGRYGPFCEEFHGCICDDQQFADLITTCDDNCGCREIVRCAIETGCLASGDTISCLVDCADVIEANGGLSSLPGALAMELAFEFDLLIARASCDRGCM